MYLSDFKTFLPSFLVPQEDGLRWLAAAHARHGSETSEETFFKLLNRFGCRPDKISRRGTFLKDFTHQNWESMRIFNEPSSIEKRQAFFQEILSEPAAQLYPETQADFQHWIHVSCTGYVSPSLVQSLISQRGWGDQVQALHAYHMGCYAAFPALRMARGNLNCEILHTELCTLHLDPARHEPEQLVIQSLFADGMIRYRASEKKSSRSFRLEDMNEKIAAGSLSQMTWDLSSHGFRMTLSREVPNLVQESVAALVSPWQESNSVYAIHPGGPRIIDAVKDALGLSEEQVHFSREVLRLHGNMSSATLPHVWQKMLEELPIGTPVVSMAFGPGLTLAGSRMRVVE